MGSLPGRVAPYRAVAVGAFRRQATYRAAAVAGVFTNTVFGVIIASVMVATFRERPLIDGLDSQGAVTLTFVGQAMLVVLAVFGWREVAERVRTGDIATDLLQPVSFSWYAASMFLGVSAYSLVARGVAPLVAGSLLFDVRLASEPATWLWFGLSIIGAAFVASRWWFVVNLAAFWWTGDIRGIIQLASALLSFCSGSIVPLQLLPGALETVVRATPFAALVQFPGEVLLGLRSGPGTLGLQLLWGVALHLVGLAVLRAGTTKLVIDGG